MTQYEELQSKLDNAPKTWLVTGVAGFIGSNLLEHSLKLNQTVVGLDNFATGHQHNMEEVKAQISPGQWQRFSFIEGDIRNLKDCRQACEGVDYVLHQAALGSVPRSINDPIATDGTNIGGFLNMLVAARDAVVASFTYAASSSTYGDHPVLPKVEENIGKPLSPSPLPNTLMNCMRMSSPKLMVSISLACATSMCSASDKIQMVPMLPLFRNGPLG